MNIPIFKVGAVRRDHRKGEREMAKIFMVRIEDVDFDEIREKYGKESLQATDDEQAMKDFLVESGISEAQAWQIK
jgi:hypothetical protein